MTVLRSREVPPILAKPKPEPRRNGANVDPPATPLQTRELATRISIRSVTSTVEPTASGSSSAPVRKRSLQLASKFGSGEDHVRVSEEKRGIDQRDGVVSAEKCKRKKSNPQVECSGFERDKSNEFLYLRSGKRVAKMRVEGCSDVDGVRLHFDAEVDDSVITVEGSDRSEAKSDRKGKGFLTEEVVTVEKVKGNQVAYDLEGRTEFNRKKKGKKRMVDDALLSKGEVEMHLESEDKSSNGDNVEVVLTNEWGSRGSRMRENVSRIELFHDIARQAASRFAHFDPGEEDNHLYLEAERGIPSVEESKQDVEEDWPGPFSTAMKIIRDRAEKMNLQRQTFSQKTQSESVIWVPKKGKGQALSKPSPPSLLELSMRILVNNADAISSLEHVPDSLRSKLSQVLCDSRLMNYHFLNLLVRGCPTEIRLKDCSWLTEAQFTNCFEGCDTSKLTVLQLDQCGRCVPDYILLSTLAQSSNRLPALATLSLTGAYRLSDVGLSSLVSSAPALRSINLSQCSLITSAGIQTLAASLGSVLQELYIDDCRSIDALLILPALKKMEHLEVLSLAGMDSVSDDFMWEFIVYQGHNLKDLNLKGCWKLTDSSLKIIAETCSGLRALELVNLSKLTDSTLGYLSNGCRSIQTLKLGHNAFSDDAIAAFLETSGENLKELSLNNVRKVAFNTALSLARRAKNLLSLDLSWCRNLTNDAVGLIVDSCLSLRVVKLFGCTQITDVFLDGHSNAVVKIIGLKLSPILKNAGI